MTTKTIDYATNNSTVPEVGKPSVSTHTFPYFEQAMFERELVANGEASTWAKTFALANICKGRQRMTTLVTTYRSDFLYLITKPISHVGAISYSSASPGSIETK